MFFYLDGNFSHDRDSDRDRKLIIEVQETLMKCLTLKINDCFNHANTRVPVIKATYLPTNLKCEFIRAFFFNKINIIN